MVSMLDTMVLDSKPSDVKIERGVLTFLSYLW
jgi:hypothetical protein